MPDQPQVPESDMPINTVAGSEVFATPTDVGTDLKVWMARMDIRMDAFPTREYIDSRFHELSGNYVRKEEFGPVQKVAYGTVCVAIALLLGIGGQLFKDSMTDSRSRTQAEVSRDSTETAEVQILTGSGREPVVYVEGVIKPVADSPDNPEHPPAEPAQQP